MEIGRRDQLAAFALVVLLLAVVGGLLLRRTWLEEPQRTEHPRAQRDAVLFERFGARRERSEEGDRLSVSLRLRTSESVSLPCYVFVVARNDQHKLWGIWPPQPPGAAITAGGHFLGARPRTGYAVTLSDQWQRISATLSQPNGEQPFDTVIVYVVDPDGLILLARPFRV